MRIQIIKKTKQSLLDDVFIEKVRSLWNSINKHEDVDDEFTWTHAEEIDLISDFYIEIISAEKLKVGFIPKSGYRTAKDEINESQFNHLHWVTISDHTPDKNDLISKFLLFIMGMVCVPTQMGWFMTDCDDLRTALQYGNEAMYISSNELNLQSWIDSKIILSSMMLLNENLLMNKKLEIAADLVPRSLLSKDYLAIINITNSNNLPVTNMLLLVF